MNKPIAWCLKAHSDGSYGEPVVFVGYSMFTENLEKAKKHPWIIYGAGELVPLYAASVAKEPVDQGYSKVHPAEFDPVAQDMVMVPIEPTEAMVSAAFRQHVFDPPVGPINNHLRVIVGIYKAMLAAAPQHFDFATNMDAAIDEAMKNA